MCGQRERKFGRVCALLLLLANIIASRANAHPLDLALLTLTPGEHNVWRVRLEVNPSVANALLGKGSRDEQVALDRLLTRSRPSLGDQPCTWQAPFEARLDSASVFHALASMRCPEASGRLRLELPLLAELPASYRVLSVYSEGKQEQLGEASVARPWIEVAIQDEDRGFMSFLGLGMEHIGVALNQWTGPGGFRFPEGIDHFVFIFALILDWGSLLGLLRTITGFTLGHTLALTLSLLGLVRLPSQWVECLIAATIAFAAALALLGQLRRSGQTSGSALARRGWIPACIGLIHGLGFASAIQALHLTTRGLARAILGFNCGVELAQALVIALAYPIFRWVRDQSWGERVIFPGLTSALLLLAVFWSVQRGLGV